MTKTIEINNPEKDFEVTVVANIEFLESDIIVAKQIMDSIHRVYKMSYNDIEINTGDITAITVYWEDNTAFVDIHTSVKSYIRCYPHYILYIG